MLPPAGEAPPQAEQVKPGKLEWWHRPPLPPAPCPQAPGNEDFRCWGREWWGNSPPVPPAGGEQAALGYLWGGDLRGLNDRQKLLSFPLAFWPQARLKYPQSHQQHAWGRSLELGTTGKPRWEKATEEQRKSQYKAVDWSYDLGWGWGGGLHPLQAQFLHMQMRAEPGF